MRLIDADKLKENMKNAVENMPTPAQRETGRFLMCTIDAVPEEPLSKILEWTLYDMKSKHMADDMFGDTTAEDRRIYRERYGIILKAVKVLEEMENENEQ